MELPEPRRPTSLHRSTESAYSGKFTAISFHMRGGVDSQTTRQSLRGAQ